MKKKRKKKTLSQEIYEEHRKTYLDRPFYRHLSELEAYVGFRAATPEEREASKEDAKKYFDKNGSFIEIEEKNINDVAF